MLFTLIWIVAWLIAGAPGFDTTFQNPWFTSLVVCVVASTQLIWLSVPSSSDDE